MTSEPATRRASVDTESLRTGVKFTVAACLKNGANSAPQYCKNVNGTE